MKFTKELATQIIEENDLSLITLRAWKKRGNIPQKYFSKVKRVKLSDVLKAGPIETAVTKYGQELERLIQTRTFKADQKDSYYNIALISLCRECETYLKTGKLS